MVECSLWLYNRIGYNDYLSLALASNDITFGLFIRLANFAIPKLFHFATFEVFTIYWLQKIRNPMQDALNTSISSEQYQQEA